MIQALLKKLKTRRPRLRRTTLVNVRYDLGLGLCDLKKTKHFGEQDTPEYLKMRTYVDKAIKRLLNECEIIEDFDKPEDLRRNHGNVQS